MHLTPAAILLLLATGLIAGLVDAVAGGGGLIALPMLLSLGMPPQLAIGTSKLQSCVGTLTACRTYVRKGVVDLSRIRLGVACTFAGALLGSWVVERIDSSVLGRLIPWLLGAILVYAIFRPEVGQADRPARMGYRAFFVVFGLGLGFYDGFFGPGAGSFWTISLVLVLGQNFLPATGATKVMNATSNVASLLLFIPAGWVSYPAGLVMSAGQILGGWIGAHLVVRRGARFIRPFFLAIVAVTLVRLVVVGVRR